MKTEREIRYVITQQCSLNCWYCHKEGITENNFSKELLTPQDYGFFFKVSSKLGINSTTLSGGEPLQREDIHEIAQNLKKHGCYVVLVTNGLFLRKHKDLWKSIDELHLSLHGAEVEHLCKNGTLLNQDILRGVARFCNYKYITLGLNAITLMSIFNNCEAINNYLNFAYKYNAVPRFIELYPPNLSEFLSHDEFMLKLNEIGFAIIDETLRKIILSNGEKKLELIQLFCRKASNQKDPAQFCNTYNDLFLAPNGFLKTCMNNSAGIPCLATIKSRDSALLLQKIKEGYALVGKNCIYENEKTRN